MISTIEIDVLLRRVEEMMRVVNEVAPAARATPLAAAPVAGAVVLGMEAAGGRIADAGITETQTRKGV